MSLVLDASTALSWFFADEAGDHLVLRSVRENGAHVPSIWRLEVANALQFAIRRKRMNLTSRDAAISRMEALPIAVDPQTDRRAWVETLRLADRFNLTVYDATYLELALRLGLPVATLDRALASAARSSKLEVLGM